MAAAVTLTDLALGGLFLYGLVENEKGRGNGPDKTVDIYRQRDMAGLTDDTRDIIELITFSDNTDPVGSFKYKAHKYPGDIDIFEPVKICCSKKDATTRIVRELKQIAQRVKNSKTFYWGDFKAGQDFNLKPEPGMSAEAYRANVSSYLNRDQLDRALSDYPESAREFYVVRWTADQILAGQQQLLSGTTLTLEEAITHDSIVKLDLWAPVNGNYTEVTNFFLFIMQDSQGNETVLNAQLGDRLESLEHDISKYSSKAHWNPLKLAKRLWNKALYLKDHRMTKRLYPLFSSGAAQLNQIVGESETLRMMFEKLPNPPTQRLVNQIQGFKRRINDVNDINFDANELYVLLERAAQGRGNQDTIEALLQVEKRLKAIVSSFSENYLKKQLGYRKP